MDIGVIVVDLVELSRGMKTLRTRVDTTLILYRRWLLQGERATCFTPWKPIHFKYGLIAMGVEMCVMKKREERKRNEGQEWRVGSGF